MQTDLSSELGVINVVRWKVIFRFMCEVNRHILMWHEAQVEQRGLRTQYICSALTTWKACYINNGHDVFKPNVKLSLSVRFSGAGTCCRECEHNMLALFVFICDCSCRPCSCIGLPFVQRVYQRPCSNARCGDMHFKAYCMKSCRKYKPCMRCLNCWCAG